MPIPLLTKERQTVAQRETVESNMTPFQLIIQQAIQAGRQQVFQAAGAGALRFIGRGLATGALLEVGALGVRWLLSQYGIDWDPNGTDPYPPGGSGSNDGKCIEVVAGHAPVPLRIDTTGQFPYVDVGNAVEIGGWQYGQNSEGETDSTFAEITYRADWGSSMTTYTWQLTGTALAVYLYVADEADCAQDGGTGGGVQPDPIVVTEGNCNYTVEFKNYIYAPGGKISGDLWLIEGSGPTLQTTSALTQCTISPTIVYSPVTGPDEFINPFGEDGENLTIEEIIRQIKSGQRDSVNEINDHTDESLEQWFDDRVPVIGGGNWDLQGVCERDANGNKLDPQPTESWSYNGGPAPVVANYQLELVQEIIQQLLDWRHEICSEEVPLEGDWVTLEFKSDEISPHGNACLRKIFRYRSKSGRDLGETIDYWKDFTWDAGPVCVRHIGAWWGKRQCWADSIAEGKRVIEFAGTEAGIDPNQEGQWLITGSDDPRYGQPGTMRIRINQGTYCITKRSGPSGLPLVGTVDTDL